MKYLMTTETYYDAQQIKRYNPIIRKKLVTHIYPVQSEQIAFMLTDHGTVYWKFDNRIERDKQYQEIMNQLGEE